jgi:hypothetical protein
MEIRREEQISVCMAVVSVVIHSKNGAVQFGSNL